MSKEGEFWVEFEHPLATKIELLEEFVRENKLLGLLDKRYAVQWLRELDKMHVTKMKATVQKNPTETWALLVTINFRKELVGTGPNFEEALINLCENLELYVYTARTAC